MKRQVFEDLDGYSEDVLTEDYDFTHRCYINGFDIVNIPLPVENLAAHSLNDWWGQRKRWMTGYFQVFSRLLRETFSSYRGYRTVLSVLISGGSILGGFLMLTIVSKFIILFLLGFELVYGVPVAVIIFMALFFRLYDRKNNFVEETGFSWVFTPLIFPLFSLITIRSFAQFIFDRNQDWYRVEK
jgi:cellulose synthase/poly-beta-1,6-N-acetylglucosamine synthase-like glycosyltransferase